MKREGFTLVEVLVAMAILAIGAGVLLSSVMGAADLFVTAEDVVKKRTLIEQAIGVAELRIYDGELGGEEDFGKRFENYSFKWNAVLNASAGEEIPLYDVTITVYGPEDFEATVQYLLYNVIF